MKSGPFIHAIEKEIAISMALRSQAYVTVLPVTYPCNDGCHHRPTALRLLLLHATCHDSEPTCALTGSTGSDWPDFKLNWILFEFH